MPPTPPKNNRLSDQELVEAANKGDSDAMELLYFRYQEWVYALAWRLCGDREDALEVLQEVFAYFFDKFPGFKLRSRLKTFLYPVVRNTALNLIRKRRRIIPLSDTDAASLPDERYDSRAEHRKLAELIEGLSTPEQELALMRFYDGFRIAEIAQIQNVPIGTVKSRLHRMLAHLRKLLQPE